MVRKVFGGFCFVVALGLLGLFYISAGGREAFGEFTRAVSNGRAFQGERLLYLGGFVALSMLAVAFLFFGGKKPADQSD